MIITHDADGRILGTINDPVAAVLREGLIADGTLFIEVVPPKVMHIYVDPEGESHEVWNDGTSVPADPAMHYVADGKLLLRPKFEIADKIQLIADGDNSHTFELPENAQVKYGDETLLVEDGELTITSAMPDSYELGFSAFPYLDKTVKVTTHAA